MALTRVIYGVITTIVIYYNLAMSSYYRHLLGRQAGR